MNINTTESGLLPFELWENLRQIRLISQDFLQAFIQNNDSGAASLLEPAFGTDVNTGALQQLLLQFGEGNFTSLPEIEIRTSEELSGARGAYISELDRLFLSRDFLETAPREQVVAVYLEEIGHAIDARINHTDSAGDEGAIFSAIVRGVELSETQLQALHQENDAIQLVIEGQTFAAEADMDPHPDDPGKAAEHQALMNLSPMNTATHVAIASGNWFDSSTWASGQVPTAGAIVHIPENINVTYEGSSNTPLFIVRVDGNLTFTARNGANTKIVVDTLFTTPTSYLGIDADAATDGKVDIEIRPFDIQAHKAGGASGWSAAAIAYYSDGATVTDTGAGTRSSANYTTVSDGAGVLGRYNWDPQQLSIGVITHGAARINGQQKLSKSAIATTAMAGDTSIELDEVPAGWKIGDQIVITGTRYVARETGTGESRGTQDEIRTVTQISGKTVTFDRALNFNHDTPRSDLKAYAANLTRNIEFHSATDLSIEGVLEADDVGDIASSMGHVMFMHNEDVQVRYASFDDLGRTNKNDVLDDFQRKGFDGLDAERIRQNDQWVKTPTNQITNMRGRYAVHLHRAGASEMDSTALIEGSVVTGGPGWGFVSHDSRADFSDNVTYGVLGAGFMAETGNETGTWSGNMAINTYGADYNDATFDPNRDYRYTNNSTDLTMILEKRGSWKNHDMAHFGNGFWFQGKLIDAIDNISVNSGLDGYFFMFRAPDQINVDPEVLEEPLSVHSPNGIHPFAPGLNVFVGNQSIADTRGLEMIGIGGGRTNDERSVISDFTAWEVGDVGLGSQYYPGFTVKDSTFIASTNPSAKTDDGILWRQVQVDTVLANLEIIGFDQQYDLRKKWSTGAVKQQGFKDPYVVISEALANGEENPLPYAYAHFLIDPGFTASQAAQPQFMGTTYDPLYDQILTSSDLQIGRFDIEFDDSSLKIDLDNKNIKYGTLPEDPVRPTLQEGHVLLLKGTKTDSIGTIPINYHNNVLVWMEDAVQHRLETVGYHLMPSGSLGVILEELFSDRFTAAKHIVKFVAELDSRWDLAKGINLGIFNPANYPDVYVPQFLLDLPTDLFPNAVNDTITVNANSSNNVVEMLANDSSFGNGLASFTLNTTNTNGSITVDDRGTADKTDDRVLYTPPANFTGTDIFNYTITDTDGDSDSAQVSVIVKTPTAGDAIARIEVGGDGFTDIDGNVWSADYGFQGGSISYLAGPIAGTNNDEIYYGKRYGNNFSYDIPLADGNYDVVIHMTEPRDDATVGSRVFDVSAEGALGLDNFDMYVALGANAAPRTAVTGVITDVSVVDGNLDLDFATVAGRPANIAGIEIFLADGTPSDLFPEATADTTTVNANSTNNIVDVLANDSSFGDGLASLTLNTTTSANGGTITVDDQGNANPTDDRVLYTPPANFDGTDTFNYTITDTDGDTASAQVSVTVNPAAPTGDSLIRIDVGGNGFTDIYGNVWSADYGFQGGSTSYRAQPIAGTDNDQLFNGKRYGDNFGYNITLANGNYNVFIYMAEPRDDATVGSRVFDVSAEGALRLDNFDMYVALGANAAPRTAVTGVITDVSVVDGNLDLDFATVAGRPPHISGIEIFAFAV